jgi:hypothetical protein
MEKAPMVTNAIERYADSQSLIDFYEQEFKPALLTGGRLDWTKSFKMVNGKIEHTVEVVCISSNRKLVLATQRNKNFMIALKAAFRETELSLKKKLSALGTQGGETNAARPLSDTARKRRVA